MDAMTKVQPAAPVAPWLGGKKALEKKIIERIDAIPHLTYAEPFVGMGGVFLRRSWKPRLEVANDLNNDITNLFRVLQNHHAHFIEFMRWMISSRDEFERMRAMEPESLTDLQRAARFLYLQRLAFGGKLGGVFGVATDRQPRFSINNLEPILNAAHARVHSVDQRCARDPQNLRRVPLRSGLAEIHRDQRRGHGCSGAVYFKPTS